MVNQEEPEVKNDSSYNKKPWWYWLILYLVIAGVLYLAIYYLFFAKSGY